MCGRSKRTEGAFKEFKVEVAIVLNVGLDYVIKAGYYSGAVANNQ